MSALVKPLDDVRNGLGRVLIVNSHANDLGTGQSQRRHLFDGAGNVRGVGVGHGLNHDRNLPADPNLSDFDRWCFPALNLRHEYSLPGAGVAGKLNRTPSSLCHQVADCYGFFKDLRQESTVV